MSYHIKLSESALEDPERHRKAGERGLLRKIATLLKELIEHPRTGTGKPKRLKGDLAGLYARRIDNKHRLVYEIEDDVVTVLVLSVHGHYGDR